MGTVSTVRIFEEMKRLLTLTAVKVNDRQSGEWAIVGATRTDIECRIDGTQCKLGRRLTLTPVKVSARPALHLFANTQTQGCKSWEARS